MRKLFKRYLSPVLRQDLKNKILLVTGPRQCGKTTLARSLSSSHDYLNYDNEDHQKILRSKSWDREKKYIIFDEVHKKTNWKRWLKGVYDTEGLPPGMLVTGSARLDLYKKAGDSMAGRFFQFRLHPFDVKEITKLGLMGTQEALDRLLRFGGFPEPFLQAKPSFYGKWTKSHNDIILRQDMLHFIDTKQLSSIETLVMLLKNRVASPVSYTSLAEDLSVAPKTVKNWLRVLENLYVVFKLTPYHKNIARSLVKAPKYYFYDTAQVQHIPARFENTVALALLKHVHFLEDVEGRKAGLFYLRNKDQKEVDFLITNNQQPVCMIEVKWSDSDLSKSLRYFSQKIPSVQKVQLVHTLKREYTFPQGVEIRKAAPWLASFQF